MTDRMIFVTGAGRGIGRAIAIMLSEAGYKVAGCARTLGELEETRRLSNARIRIQALDARDPSAVGSWMESELAESGAQPWGLVTAAGIYGPIGPFWENEWDSWKSGLEINLFGSFHASRYFVRKLLETGSPGRIVMLSGGGATQPLANFSSYCASKAAVVRFAETIAHELKPHGITVNSVAPGAVNTRLTEELIQAGPKKAGKAFYEKAVKQRDGGGTSPTKAAELVTYLMRDDVESITGRLISAVWDPWPSLREQSSELASTDIYTLRRIVPEDRRK